MDGTVTMLRCPLFFGLFALYLIIQGLFSATTGEIIVPVHVKASLQHRYYANVTYSSPLAYSYSDYGNSGAIRVTVTTLNATEKDPIIVLLKRQYTVISWPVPLVLEDNFIYSTVIRVICPQENSGENDTG